MRAVTGTGGPGYGGSGSGRGGRWIWGVSGAVTAVALAVPGVLLIGRAGAPADAAFATPQHLATETVTVPGHVTSVAVDSYGAPVSVRASDVRQVQVAETIMWNGPDAAADDVPAVSQTVSGGHLTLAAPECQAADFQSGPRFNPGFAKISGLQSAVPGAISAPPAPLALPAASAGPVSDCEVAFDVTAPKDVSVSVSSAGGPVSVSGVAGANLDSGGGFVTATQVAGPLTVTSDGGMIRVDGATGTLNADSGGGSVLAQNLTSPVCAVTTEDGMANLSFATAPETVTVHTDGGPAQLAVPGGPYSLTADSDGGPEFLRIPVTATASRSITVSTLGGMLRVGSPGIAGQPAS